MTQEELAIAVAAGLKAFGDQRAIEEYASPQEKLHGQIVAVMSEVGTFGRDQRNKHAGYDFVSIDKMYERIRPILAKHGLRMCHVLHPVTSRTITGVELSVLPVELWITNGVAETPHSTWEVPLQVRTSKGVIYNPQTKGGAVSYAVKYYLRAEFMVPTGDQDIDALPTEPQQVEEPPKSRARTTTTRTRKKTEAPPPPEPVNDHPQQVPVEAQAAPPGEPVSTELVLTENSVIETGSGHSVDDLVSAHGRQGVEAFFRALRAALVAKNATTDQKLVLLDRNLQAIATHIPQRGREALWPQVEKLGAGDEINDSFRPAA